MLSRTTRRTVLLAVAAALLLFVANGGAQESAIPIIRARYAAVNRGLKRCQKIEVAVPEVERYYALEGNSHEAYLCNGAPRKIVGTYYGETGRSIDEYYYWDGELFFVLSKNLRYDKTFGKVVRINNDRFYFAGGRLVRWVDEGGRRVKVEDDEARRREREYLDNGKELLTLASSAGGETNVR